jgi:putative tricarboxylic transport membrane protein
MYVTALSVALVVTALVYGYLAWRRARALPPAAAASVAQAPKGAVWPVYAAIVGYAVLIPVLGYPIATALFLAAEFRLLGVRSWGRNVALSLAVTAVFYVLFAHYAEMIFPRGVLSWT